MRALPDTNILVDYPNGMDAAREEMDRYREPLISAITLMEVMIAAESAERGALRAFLGRFVQVPMARAVAEGAVAIRHQHRIRLPDAIV